MSTPGAEDASRSPDYSGDQDESDMAEVKAEAHHEGADPSQKTTKPSSNAKDPQRPRRKKARRACMACQRAHLTCDDERPCNRCIKRGLHDQCQDGVRKKAKYLHDAPDAALQPPVIGRSYAQAHASGNHPQQLPGQELGAVTLAQQSGFYAQAPSNTYFAQNPAQAQTQVQLPPQDHTPVGPFNNAQASISPQYNQPSHNPIPGVPSSVPQGPPSQVPQFGGPLFDPSDPALFNFDISSLNFGNHYGALEMGMLGHMSSGAAETSANDKNMMNAMSQAAGMYNQQVAYGENPAVAAAIAYEQSGLTPADWQNAHSRQGSLQMHTPNNTPTIANLEHAAHRHDSLHGPHAFSIGQGPASFSSPSPASTEVNGGTYETDNTLSGATYFHNQGQHQGHQRSPHMNRLQQENRMPNTALQPIPSNVIRKRRRDTKWIYESIKKPHNYVDAFHRFFKVVESRYRQAAVDKIRVSMSKHRPALIHAAGSLQPEDLIHQEQALQLSLVQLEESFSEVGVPSVVCRRSGEVVWLNKEFQILTGWSREVLLGMEPNLNVNTGATRDLQSGNSTRTNTTPVISGQQDPNSTGTGTRQPVLIIELMDERSAVEYLDDFAEAVYSNSRATPRRRVNFLKYQTSEDIARQEHELKTKAQNGHHNGFKNDTLPRLEGGPVHQEKAMSKLGSKDGMVDCMIQWHVKRDNFDIPMLICMHIMPVLDTQPIRPLTNQ